MAGSKPMLTETGSGLPVRPGLRQELVDVAAGP